MKSITSIQSTTALALVALSVAPLHAADISSLLADYRAAGAEDFSAQRGAELWTREVAGEQGSRSCTRCHGERLDQPGEHVRTGKRIEAMDPQTAPGRYGDPAKVEKWFLRNCKWTWNRECTAQEKGDLLTHLNDA